MTLWESVKMHLYGATMENARSGIKALGRASTYAVGSVEGGYRLGKMKMLMESFYTRELTDEKVLEQTLRHMFIITKMLKKYDDKEYNRIYKVYMVSPEKVKEVLTEIAMLYRKNIDDFFTQFQATLEALESATKFLNSIDSAFFEDIIYFVFEACDQAHKKRFESTDVVTEMTKQEILKISKKKKRRLLTRMTKQRNLVNKMSSSNARNIFGMGVALTWLGYRWRRLIDRMVKREFEKMLIERQDLQNQVDGGRLQIQFYSNLRDYLSNIEVSGQMGETAKKDILRYYTMLEKDLSSVRISIAEFVRLFQNEEIVMGLHAQVMKIKEMNQNLKAALEMDIDNTGDVIKDIDICIEEVPGSLDKIKVYNRDLLKEIQTPSGAEEYLETHTV